jgi:hypothetical protein
MSSAWRITGSATGTLRTSRLNAIRSSPLTAARASGPDRRRRPHDVDLLVVRRMLDDDVEHEAIELRFGQRIRAFELDRVLRREDVERLVELVGAPWMVTRCSCIASSSADCVFGGVRLISSASTMLAKIGPARTPSAGARSARLPAPGRCR